MSSYGNVELNIQVSVMYIRSYKWAFTGFSSIYSSHSLSYTNYSVCLFGKMTAMLERTTAVPLKSVQLEPWWQSTRLRCSESMNFTVLCLRSTCNRDLFEMSKLLSWPNGNSQNQVIFAVWNVIHGYKVKYQATANLLKLDL